MKPPKTFLRALVATTWLVAPLALAQDPHADHAQKSDHAGHSQGGMDKHHDFSDAERWSKIFDDPERMAWQKPQEVVEKMAITPGMVVADLGAGTGFFLGYLSAAVGPSGKVLALDPEANLVTHMRQRILQAGWANTEARQIPYDSSELPAASVDRILIVDTWHHIQDRVVYAQKLAKTFKKGGALYVVDFTLESPVGPKKDHRLAPEIVSAELQKGGFKVETLEESLPNQYILRATLP